MYVAVEDRLRPGPFAVRQDRRVPCCHRASRGLIGDTGIRRERRQSPRASVLSVPILLDAPANTTRQWVSDMERAGVDGFAITTNIDVGIGSATAFETAQTLRSWIRLLVAVSGGFSIADHTQLTNADWDILIVGRSVTDTVDPVTAAAHIVELTHQTGRQA